MVILIDTVRYAGKMEITDSGREIVADNLAEAIRQQDSEVLAPARGIIYGLLLSSALWLGVAAVARTVLTMMR